MQLDAGSLLDAVLADPPAVHTMGPGQTGLGTWATDRSLYELLLSEVKSGSVTLETGSGVSTALLAAVGAQHTCVTPFVEEQERLAAWAERVEVDLSSVRFAIGSSAEVLPALSSPPLDVLLIDGGHGFPIPSIDWFYGARLLRDGGLLIVDDAHLPAVATLVDFLDRDPRWRTVTDHRKWCAYRRVGSDPLLLDHHQQPWYRASRPSDLGVRELSRLLVGASRRSVRRRLGGRLRRAN
jgi:hypothetical protein